MPCPIRCGKNYSRTVRLTDAFPPRHFGGVLEKLFNYEAIMKVACLNISPNMPISKLALTTLLVFLPFEAALIAQGAHSQNLPGFQHSSGISWSIAYGVLNEYLPEGRTYQPLTFLGRFDLTSFGPVDLYAESQFSSNGSRQLGRTDYEFGMNLGFSYYVSLGAGLDIGASLGTGPHYITVETSRQARGFIFSDNFELGVRYYASRFKVMVELKGRYRHISNAGLREPNGGIDNGFVILGISQRF